MTKTKSVNLGLDHPKLSPTLNSSPRITPVRLIRNVLLNYCNLTIVLCFVFGALSAQAQTADIDRSWSTVGSAGTVDENDVRKVFFDHSTAQMGRVVVVSHTAGKPAVISPITQSAVIRYNVTPVDSFFVPLSCSSDPGPGVTLKLRYLISGNNARVIAKLIEVDLATGREDARMTFDSKGKPLSNKYQVGFERGCGRQPFNFDFKNKAYYIEATLITNGLVATGAAGIQTITIENLFVNSPG